jgi:hypothetical protein
LAHLQDLVVSLFICSGGLMVGLMTKQPSTVGTPAGISCFLVHMLWWFNGWSYDQAALDVCDTYNVCFFLSLHARVAKCVVLLMQVVLAPESAMPADYPDHPYVRLFNHRPLMNGGLEQQEQLQQRVRAHLSHHHHHYQQQQQQRQQKSASSSSSSSSTPSSSSLAAAGAGDDTGGVDAVGRKRSLTQIVVPQQGGFEEGAAVAEELGLVELGPPEVTMCQVLKEVVEMHPGGLMRLRAEASHHYAEQRGDAVRAVQRLMQELLVLQKRAAKGREAATA